MKTKIAFLLLPAALALSACMDTTEDRTLLGTTAAAATAGCVVSTSSTSRGNTLKPPLMIMSFERSTM